MKQATTVLAFIIVCVVLVGCRPQGEIQSSDQVQQAQQEVLMREATSQTGMPAIKNFRERKLLKEILELRDQEGLTTYTYLWNEFNGRLVFLGESIGYGIPYSTQFTAPEKLVWGKGPESEYRYNMHNIPQAEPNGLFSPGSAEGTWVLLKDPNGKDVRPVYVEPRILVSPFRLKTE